MKALTLTQPWATLVAIGAKRYETRSWSTNYRGPLAIHAAKGMPGWAIDICHERMFSEALAAFPDHAEGLPRGQVIAIVNLRCCWPIEGLLVTERITEQEAAFGDFGPNRFAWLLTRPAIIEPPEPARGALGLWEWTPSAIVQAWLEDHYPEVAA